jgi:hypothetical protein
MNNDEHFIHIGAYERGIVRPIYLFLHVLQDRARFDLNSIPGVYNLLVEERLIRYSGAICIVVTLDEGANRVSIIYHSESTKINFTPQDVQYYFKQCMNMVRTLPKMLVVGKGAGEFYTKHIPSIQTTEYCSCSNNIEEFSNIVYHDTRIMFPV